MTEKIIYKVLCDENMKITRIFFEIKETGEQIEGTHQIEKWVNSLFKEIKQLKSENEDMKRLKESWKSDACFLSNLNGILSNELSIAQEQGYEPSKPYKEYIASIKTEYDKIKIHNNRLKESKE